MKTSTFFAILLLFTVVGCTSKQSDQLSQQQKEQIQREITVIGDSIMARAMRLDARWLDYYMDSPDWGMVNMDGSRWDYQYAKNNQLDTAKSYTSWKWTTTHQDFKFLAKDIVIYAWDGKDETILKSGDKIACNPHAYTLVFKNVAGQWKVIYSHDSAIPVNQKADQK